MRTSAAPNAESIRRVEKEASRPILTVPQCENGLCSRDGDVMRTAGVHAGRGDCNRAVEVCVSGFGKPNRNRGGDNPGERFQRVQRLVARWAVACAGCRRGETHKKRRHEGLYSGYGRGVVKRNKTQIAVYQDSRENENGVGDSSLSVVGQARRNESRRDWGSWEVGGEGGKETLAGGPN